MNVKATVWRRYTANLPKAAGLRMGPLGGRARKRTAIFARVASDDGSSKRLTDQLAACQRFADQHHLNVVKRYNHVGAGMRGPRPDLTTLMADAERGLFQVLVVTSQDRLSRDASRLVASIEMFKSLGVEVHIVADEGPAAAAPRNTPLFRMSERVGRKWRKGND